MKVLAIGLSIFISTMAVAEINEQSLINSSMRGDYQAQRNLAYNYQNGWGKVGDSDYIPKDIIRSCAWRKIILITNSAKADNGDTGNESIDCKTVHPVDNAEVWNLVYSIYNTMNKQSQSN